MSRHFTGRSPAAGSSPTRLVAAVLRCYPARWRRRHGQEAAELAALLIQDGTPAASVALSYLAGAAREWLTPPPGRRLTAVACALLAAAGLLVSAAVLASAGPARAASTSAPGSTVGPPGPARGQTACPLLVLPPTGYLQLITQRAGHDRPC